MWSTHHSLTHSDNFSCVSSNQRTLISKPPRWSFYINQRREKKTVIHRLHSTFISTSPTTNMKTLLSCLFLLLTLSLYLQSTTVERHVDFVIYLFLFTQAYPSSFAQRQRGYLLCQLSAVSCKRSLPNAENSSELNADEYLQMCLALNKPLRHCLGQALTDPTNMVK